MSDAKPAKGREAWVCDLCGATMRPGNRARHKRTIHGIAAPFVREATPTACAGCGRPLRAYTQPPSEGVQVHRGRGMCSMCYDRQKRAARGLLRVRQGDHCTECDKPFAPGKTGAVPEGHVRYGARGMCKPCYNRHQRAMHGATPRKPLTDCRACGIPLISKRAPQREGFAPHGGLGLCRKCYEAQDRKAAAFARMMGLT